MELASASQSCVDCWPGCATNRTILTKEKIAQDPLHCQSHKSWTWMIIFTIISHVMIIMMVASDPQKQVMIISTLSEQLSSVDRSSPYPGRGPLHPWSLDLTRPSLLGVPSHHDRSTFRTSDVWLPRTFLPKIRLSPLDH